MRRIVSCLGVMVVVLVVTPAVDAAPPQQPQPSTDPAASEQWSPPVPGPVVREYEAPKRPFGPQHLGIDYSAAPGTPVRAAGDGRVAFAGLVGRSRSVALEHPGGRRTTYAYLRRVSVPLGASVRRGDVLGFSGGEGPGHHDAVVHFGYRVNGQPQDPAQLFRPRRPRISLAPLDRPACRAKAPSPLKP